MTDTRNRKTRMKQERQETQREMLRSNGHISQAIEIAGKLQDESIDLDHTMVNRLKSAAEIHLKMVNKYLPDLKSTELAVTGSLDTGIDATQISKKDWDIVEAARQSLNDSPTIN